MQGPELRLNPESGMPRRPTQRQLGAWRAAGLINPVDPTPMLRRSDSTDLSQAIQALVARRVPLADAPLALFFDGFPVSYRSLLIAFERSLATLESEIPSETRPGDEADAMFARSRARIKRTRLGRIWIARSGEYGARHYSTLQDAFVSVFSLIYGTVGAADVGTDPAAKVFGFHPDLAGDVLSTVEMASLPRMRELLADTSADELVVARAAWMTMMEVIDRVIGDAEDILPVVPGLADMDLSDSYWMGMMILPVAAVLRAIPGYEERLENEILGGDQTPNWLN